ITLDDIIKSGIELASGLQPLSLDSEQMKGLRFVKENIKHGGLAVGIGPPGTGKTIVFSEAYAHSFGEIDKDEVIVHIAPTNRLVEETAVRTVALLAKQGLDTRDLKNSIRVYGSRFEPVSLTGDVKLVFSTGYQPGALVKLSKLKEKVHIMVDEASTTAIHQAFISLSMALINEIKKNNVKFISSLNVIGDPMQAIVESDESRWKYEHLIVYRITMSIIPEEERRTVLIDPPRIFDLAEKYADGSGIKYFFLNRTYRMPEPAEVLVSIPFYNQKLKAVKHCNEVLKDVLSDNPRAYSFINDSRYLQRYNKVNKAIDNALDSRIPVVYIRDSGDAYSSSRSYRGLDEYDELRSRLGGEIAAYLALRTNVRRIMMIAPYNEVVQQARWYVRGCFNKVLDGERMRAISFSTVHSALGSEADIIVAVLGKEYPGSVHETLYFQMPELINVQLSRHSRLIVIIGNIEKLADNMSKKGKGYKHIGKLKMAVENLKERDYIAMAEIKQ
ncbi:MAG: AAA domain-containing protein, partial [Desulfurococcaceae archaeon]